MSKIYFTADTHFGHKNIISFCDPRSHFKTIEEHDQFLIDSWNKSVGPEDTVFHLGDFFYRAPAKLMQSVCDKLNGHIYIVLGNHDRQDNLHRLSRFEDIFTRYELALDDTHIILDHYPLEDWKGKQRGSIHLHGHSHGTSQIVKNRFDVGVDCHNLAPISWSNLKLNLDNA